MPSFDAWSRFVQVMVRRLIEAKSLPKTILICSQLDPWEKVHLDMDQVGQFPSKKMQLKRGSHNGGHMVQA